MSHCESPGLMPIEQALKQQDAHIQPVTDSEFISIFDANGRIIAQQVDANINVPSADNSAMDGYALKAQNSHVPLNIIGQVLAGHPFNGTLEDGEAVRIMTGAPIPPGANAVIMQEQTKLVDGLKWKRGPGGRVFQMHHPV